MNTRSELTEKLQNMNFNQKEARKIAEAMYFEEAETMIKEDKDRENTIDPEKWLWLIENHERLVLSQEIQHYYNLMNTTNKSMYCAICELKYAEKIHDEEMAEGWLRVIKNNIDIATNFPQYSFPDMFIINLGKAIYEEHNPHKNAGRPREQHLIKMIDVETGEVFERFNTRDAVMETIGIKKANLSQCLKSSKTNPNAKSTWRKYKFEDRKYWFVEEN